MSRTRRTKRPAFKGAPPQYPDGTVRDGTRTHYSKMCEHRGGCPHCTGNRTHRHRKSAPPEDDPDTRSG